MTENHCNMSKDENIENNSEEKSLSVIKIVLPNGESFDLQVDSLELVQEIHFILTDREETCHRTCFSLKLNNKTLDNFAELKLIPELEDNVEINVVEELYNVREAKFHIKHIHDLLRSVELADAYIGRDQMSLSFVNIVTDGILSDTKSPQAGDSLDSQPPDYILPDLCNNTNGNTNFHLNGPPITHLHPIENEIKPNSCLISLNYSNWNPPPSHRILHGDLVYLYVHTLEDKRIHITGCTKGFYVNQSTDQSFNPKPATHPFLSHSIVDLLKQASPMFKRNYDSLLKRRSSRHAFERIPTPYQVYSWLSPILEHSLDSIRKEEAFCSKMAYEEHLPGQTRDWNDEMQNTRELPREKLIDRVNREKSIFKTNSDFVTAATRAAMNVLRGNIMAINPGECKKQQMYIWNNIFFALGFDIKDHYKDFGGDAAAYAANMNDLNGVRAYSALDIPGLCTLGTAVIDFSGYRVTAQTLIPGILEKEHDESVVYGSYDFGKTVVLEEHYLELLEKPSDELKIMPHKVLSKDGKEVLLKSSIECKGIIGNDKRYYILDLLFTSPPDVHYLGGVEDPSKLVGLKTLTKDDLSPSMASLGYPFSHRHQLSVLRQELLEAFCEYRYIQFLRHIKSNIDDAKTKKKEIILENNEMKIDLIEDKSLEDVKKIVDETSESGYDEVLIKQIIAKSAEAVGSLSDSKVIIKFNPDAFQLGVTVSESEKSNIERDKQLLKDASEFLVKIQIPQLIKDSLDEIITPQDGRSLIEAMHQKGINTRYLNRLIETIPNTPSLSWLKTLAVSETVIRSTKHLYKLYIQEVDPMNMSSAIAHFLNCFLSSCPNPIPCTSSEEVTKMNKTAKKNKRNKGKVIKDGNSESWMMETPSSLWIRIQEEAMAYYHYDINCLESESFCQMYNVSRTTLLRSFCQSLGIQLLLRDYIFDQKNKQSFNDEDIMNIYPIVKHLNPQATDAYKLFSNGQAHISHGHFSEGREYINEALNLLNQVYGPLHPDIASCNRLLAHLSYVLGEYQAAIMYQYRATMISERVYGIDSSNIISEYCHLGLYAFACGQFNVALNCMYRARYVALLCHGDIHPEMPNIDTNIGIMLVAVQNYEKAIQFLESALETSKIFYGAKSMKVASSYHLIARINSYKGDFRAAIQAEKECFNIYKEKLGQDNDRTKESKSRLSYWTGQAVSVAKFMQELSNGGSADHQNHHVNLPGDLESIAKAKAMAGMIPQMHLQNQQPNMIGLLDTLNLVNGIYLIQLNDEELEKIKMEINNNTNKECAEVQS